MKLIDLLVKELPKQGGWPEGVKEVEQDTDGSIFEMDSDYISDFHFKKTEDWRTAAVTKSQYEQSLAASEGWIEWGGGECPVPEKALFDVKQRDNWVSECCEAGDWKWDHDGSHLDIIAYRLHRDINSRANDDRLGQDLNECIGQGVNMQEWSGEGLPPVGVKCEVRVGRDNYEDCLVLYSGEHGCAFTYLGDNGDKHSIDCVSKHAAHDYFRPLRTEAEKAREETIMCMSHSLRANGSVTAEQLNRLYSDIASGVIHGIKLENK